MGQDTHSPPVFRLNTAQPGIALYGTHCFTAWMKRLYGFTLLDMLLGLLFCSVLSSVLITTYVTFKGGYQRVMVVATLQDDGRFAVELLRRHIHSAESIVNVIPIGQVPSALKQNLNNKSDVLILKEQGHDIAFYVAATSWTQNAKTVLALFEKPLDSRRQELVPYVEAVHFKRDLGGVYYDLTLRSQEPVLRFSKLITDRYLYRVWYGFAVPLMVENIKAINDVNV